MAKSLLKENSIIFWDELSVI
ncbi:hypothetical protein [Streptococcus pyogenes]|nr:hypothetical protein [Streptococcus pyogenes]